jgi:hypothetical protein
MELKIQRKNSGSALRKWKSLDTKRVCKRKWRKCEEDDLEEEEESLEAHVMCGGGGGSG